MNKQQLNKNYYQTNQEQLKARQKARYQAKKQLTKTQSKQHLSNYYKAANIHLFLSLKDYVESSPEKMKLWYRFSSILTQLKEGISDIIEIMRLREVMEALITDYWTTAKTKHRLTKSWNKLTFAQQQAKKKFWEKQLHQEEAELFKKLAQEEAKQKQKIHAQEEQKRVEINAYWNTKQSGKIQCPECGKMAKVLDQEHNICANCVKKYCDD